MNSELLIARRGLLRARKRLCIFADVVLRLAAASDERELKSALSKQHGDAGSPMEATALQGISISILIS